MDGVCRAKIMLCSYLRVCLEDARARVNILPTAFQPRRLRHNILQIILLHRILALWQLFQSHVTSWNVADGYLQCCLYLLDKVNVGRMICQREYMEWYKDNLDQWGGKNTVFLPWCMRGGGKKIKSADWDKTLWTPNQVTMTAVEAIHSLSEGLTPESRKYPTHGHRW